MDYAHNPAGLRGLTSFINKLPNKYRTVVLNGTGDRRDDDIREFAKIAADNFDRIVIRAGHYFVAAAKKKCSPCCRRESPRATTFRRSRIIPDSRTAIHHAIKQARKNELVVTLADLVPMDISYVQEYRDEFNGNDNRLRSMLPVDLDGHFARTRVHSKPRYIPSELNGSVTFPKRSTAINPPSPPISASSSMVARAASGSREPLYFIRAATS